MSTPANSITTNHSPRNPGGDGAAVSSPQAKQSAAGRGGAISPWMQVVRGGSDSEYALDVVPPSSPLSSPAKASSTAGVYTDDSAADAQIEGADNVSGTNNAGKKPVWNKPANDVSEVGAVMGAISWPALSESARASPKSSPSDSFKVVTDGFVPLSQGTGTSSPVSQKKTMTSVSLTSSHGAPTRQKSMKRAGGGSSTALESGVEMSSPMAGKPNSSAIVESSHSKEATQKGGGGGGGGGLVSQIQYPGGNNSNNNDHPPPQRNNSFRRGNGGSHPRGGGGGGGGGGDGSYHHNSNHGGGRRDHHDWNPHRSFNGRDMQVQSPRGVHRGFMRNPPPPPPNSAFVPPPPLHVHPFGGPVVYSEVPPPVIYVPAPSPESLRGVTLVPSPLSPHPMFYLPDPQLPSRIVNQIDYYFSNENLVKDTFLRMNMDDQGWVPIRLIAGFKKVMMLTDNIQFILEVLHSSNLVEIQGEKVRRRNDWSKWIMQPSSSPSSSSVQISSPQYGSGPDMMMFTADMQNLVLDEEAGGGYGSGSGSASRSN